MVEVVGVVAGKDELFDLSSGVGCLYLRVYELERAVELRLDRLVHIEGHVVDDVAGELGVQVDVGLGDRN